MRGAMFAYSDPAQRNFLSNATVQAEFRQRMHGIYDGFARRPNSAFTWIEAISLFQPASPSFG